MPEECTKRKDVITIAAMDKSTTPRKYQSSDIVTKQLKILQHFQQLELDGVVRWERILVPMLYNEAPIRQLVNSTKLPSKNVHKS